MSLSSTFIEALPPRVPRPDPRELEPLLEAEVTKVAAADRDRLLRGLARVMRADQDPIDTLRGLHVEDLWLAERAARGQPEAHAELDHKLNRAVRAAVSRIRPDAAFLDEVAQQLRAKLLVAPPGGAPKLLEYGGRGALSRWLEAAALRIALTLRGKERPQDVGDSALEPLEAAAPGADTALARGRLAPEVQRALEEVLRALPVRERNLLRLYFVKGLTVEEIGRIEGTHKSTVSRWLTRVRAGTLAQVRATLVQRLGLTSRELDSALTELRSQLHLSVSRVLGPRT